MLVLNAFAAISEGLKLKMFRGSMPPIALGGICQRVPSQNPPARPPILNLPCTSVSDDQSSPAPRDLPLRSHLVRLLFGSHLPIKKKKPGYGPE